MLAVQQKKEKKLFYIYFSTCLFKNTKEDKNIKYLCLVMSTGY